MDVTDERCCGLDVQAKTEVACLMTPGQKQIRPFATMTDELRQLAEWVLSAGCPHVAMESTGVEWKPVFNLLEGVLSVLLVNARHIKAVPGRKTDVRDCEWLADLLRHGLLKASFNPPRAIREWRELTRYCHSLVKEHTAVAKRSQKLLESTTIKVGQVASDGLGVRGRLMLKALAAGEQDAGKLGELAQGKLKGKKELLRRAVSGCLTETQRWVLAEWLARLGERDAALSRVEARLGEAIAAPPDPCVPEAGALLDSIPGVGEQVAQTIMAELGVAMDRVPSEGHLASWAGMGPGNNESAGKRKSGKTTKGSKFLRTALVEAAWAATHAKGRYRQAKYRRLVKRLGAKQALGAGGHTILRIAYPLLKGRVRYTELGSDSFNPRPLERQRQRLVERLEALGVKVTSEAVAEAA